MPFAWTGVIILLLGFLLVRHDIKKVFIEVYGTTWRVTMVTIGYHTVPYHIIFDFLGINVLEREFPARCLVLSLTSLLLERMAGISRFFTEHVGMVWYLPAILTTSWQSKTNTCKKMLAILPNLPRIVTLQRGSTTKVRLHTM